MHYSLPKFPRILIKKECKHKKALQKLLDTIQELNEPSGTECKLMFEEIINNNYKRVLELGVAYGYSTIPLLIACYLNKGKLFSCDIKEVHKLDFWLPEFKCEFLKKKWNFIKTIDLWLNFRKPFDLIDFRFIRH